MELFNKTNNVGIVGAGQMGSGIAQVFATAGYVVKVYDLSTEIFEKSRNRVLNSLEKLSSRYLIDKKPEEIINKISYHTVLSDLVDSHTFVESAFENYEIKTKIFSELSGYLSPTSYIATNTSSYSINKLAGMIPYPENFIGFHFMNPPPVMDLIEIVRGERTSEKTFKLFFNLAKDLNKVPIESKDSPGFVLNRILIPLINEAVCVLASGISSPQDIDTALKLGANHPIGPLALADLIGLDTVLAIMKTLQKELGEQKYSPCPLLEKYVTQGFLGKKTGKGFYVYQ
ncbi:MAG: 3-hydroxybutyryl-CoA dehydrogenase [Holosporaceae bacterium]|nr:3-hydroxybutyryl-CoA dehydrogenase [Holosporaceae bacterium]